MTTILVLSILSFIFPVITGQCSSGPTLPEHAYTLTETKASYSSGEVYEIYCVPGYTISGSSNLTCSGSSWTPDPPVCNISEILPWWVYLASIVAALLIIPCVCPRVLACICHRKNKSDDKKPLTKEKNPYHGKGGEPPGFRRHHKPITPVTDAGKHKLSQLNAHDDYGHYGKNAYY